MISVSAAPAGSSPARRPPRITRMRSATPISSGISDEIIRIATPSRASPRMRSWMPALAPTSTPRVGSSKIRTPGWIASHLASTTFCWLPPDRKRASCSSERARSSTERASSCTLTVPGSRRRCLPPSDRSASSVLSRIGWASARPSSLRSSVMKPMPALIPARGPRPTGLPSTSTVPALALSAPNSARASSVRPEPWSPARPTISPARTSIETSSRTAVLTPAARSRTSPSSSGVPRGGK